MVVVKFKFYLIEIQPFLSFLFSLAASADLERHLLEAQKKNVLSLSLEKSKFQNYLKTKEIEFTVGSDKRKFDRDTHKVN